MFVPYTYLIGWSRLDMWYYGSRTNKSAHPSDLMTKYFSSSKLVKKMIDLYGMPDVVEVRKIFVDKKSTLLWEQTVIHRMKMVKSVKWLNQKCWYGADRPEWFKEWYRKLGSHFHHRKGKTNIEMYGEEKAKEISKILSEASIKRWKEGKNDNRPPVKNETRQKISILHKGKRKKPETIVKMKEYQQNAPRKQCPHCEKQMTAGVYARYHGNKCLKNPNITQEAIDSRANNMKGKTRINQTTDETRTKMSTRAKNRTKKSCIHCGREFTPVMLLRWHGDKCKLKPSS